MKNTKTVPLLSLVAGLLVVTGCQTTTPKHSGFLGDYSQLRSNPDFEERLTYINPLKGLGEYDQFLIDTVVVHFAANAGGTAINPDNLDMLVSYFEDEIEKALSTNYRVVKKEGAGVLRLRIAITDIKKTDLDNERLAVCQNHLLTSS